MLTWLARLRELGERARDADARHEAERSVESQYAVDEAWQRFGGAIMERDVALALIEVAEALEAAAATGWWWWHGLHELHGDGEHARHAPVDLCVPLVAATPELRAALSRLQALAEREVAK